MRIPDILPTVRGRIDALSTTSVMSLRSWSPRRWLVVSAAVATLIAILIFIFIFVLPTRAFPTGKVIIIPEDVGTRTIAAELEAVGAIDAPLLFYAYVRITGLDRSLASGPYVFSEPLGIMGLAHKLASGEHGIVTARVTLTEGMTVDDMARTLTAAMPSFDADGFVALAEPQEGYLFPDTYFFLPNVTPQEVSDRLRVRFDEQIATLAPQIDASERSLEDIVKMASILEREANTPEDMRLVAGILWNRIDQEMPLQVDAVFGYLHGVNGYTPTAADLRLDSSYNTYRVEGFPPTPISNPGLEALRAAVEPTETDYLYYLTGVDGKMYYGHTFDEHRQNRALYLDI